MDGIAGHSCHPAANPSEVEVVALTSVIEDHAVIDAMLGHRLPAEGHGCRGTVSCHQGLRRVTRFLPESCRTGRVRRTHPREGNRASTDREIEVLKLLAQGDSTRDFPRPENRRADGQDACQPRPEWLGVTSRTQAALYAIRNGLPSRPSDLQASSRSMNRLRIERCPGSGPVCHYLHRAGPCLDYLLGGLEQFGWLHFILAALVLLLSFIT